MLTRFECPACKGRIEADTSMSGSQADCPHCGQAVAVPFARIDIGTTIGGFKLERRLGKGGMGEVFLARQISMDRQVAIKILPPDFAANQETVKRFLHEVRIAARLDHPNIVAAHEAGEDAGVYFLAMAFVDGETLGCRLKREGLVPEAEAVAIVRTVAGALDYAWTEHRLMHRDIKPANIMVDRRGRVLLMDLGLAKQQGEESGMTLSGTILGTPHYMSPEQATGRISELTIHTDMYSLGATLYHLVTGGVPFTGDSALQILHKHVNEALPSPRQRNPALSESCCRLIEVMMAKAATDRHSDWRALMADADRVLAGVGQAASQASPPAPTPAAAPAPVLQAEPPPGVVPPRRARKRRVLAIGIAILLAFLFLASRGGGRKARQRAAGAGQGVVPEATGGGAHSSPSGEAAVRPALRPPPPAAGHDPAAPPAQDSVAPLAPRVARQAIDLLALADPVLDRVQPPTAGANRWERQGDALVFLTDGKGGKLAPPVAIRARAYEIEVRFARLSGKGRLHVDLPLGDDTPTIVPVYLDAPGLKAANNREGPVWPADTPGAGTAIVRLEPGQAVGEGHIVIRFGGETLLEWSGRIKDVARSGDPHPAFPGQPVTSLWCHEDSYAIRAWVLRVFEGDAQVLTRPGPAEPPAAADVPATADGPPPVPLPPPPDPAMELAPLADLVLAGRLPHALKRWQEAPEERLKRLPDEVRHAVKVQLMALAAADQRLLESLEADTGKAVEIELVRGKVLCEVREVGPGAVKALEIVRRGQATDKLGLTFRLDDMSTAEKLRRLGQGDSPELNLQRGMVALQAGREGAARRYFGKAGGPLGEALAERLDQRRGAPKPLRADRPPEAP